MKYEVHDKELVLIPENTLDAYQIGKVQAKFGGVPVVQDANIKSFNVSLNRIVTELILTDR